MWELFSFPSSHVGVEKGRVELAVYTLAGFRQYIRWLHSHFKLGRVSRVDGRTNEPEELVIKQQGFVTQCPAGWYPGPS